MLLLIRADKLGKKNDNLALLVKGKMWRICNSTGVFLEAGQSWTFINDCMIVYNLYIPTVLYVLLILKGSLSVFSEHVSTSKTV